MQQNIKIAVLGGSGRTGKFLVTQLIQQGYRLKLLVRTPETFTLKSPLIEILKGDALDAGSINSLVEGCTAVISTIGQCKDEPLVASQVTTHILQAMNSYNIKRYILLAGVNVDTPFDKKGPETVMATEWMKKNFPDAHEDRRKAYGILSASELNWTLVRVPFIEYSELREEVAVSLKDCSGNKISAADIAGFLVKQLKDVQYHKKSPFISNL